MSKDQKKHTIQITITIAAIFLTFILSRSGNNVDQVKENKEVNAVQNERLNQAEQRLEKVVTKEYFDLGMESLKDYIDK